MGAPKDANCAELDPSRQWPARSIESMLSSCRLTHLEFADCRVVPSRLQNNVSRHWRIGPTGVFESVAAYLAGAAVDEPPP